MALGLLFGLTGCGGANTRSVSAPPASRTNVVLIVVDTLRADHLGCYGAERDTSPHLDALARRGVRFEHAYSVAPWTMPSVASVLTGLYPAGHGVSDPRQVLPAAAVTLAEHFAAQGYATGGVVSHKLIDSDHRYDQGFEVFDDSEARGHNHVSTPGVTARARELLAGWAGQERPFFLFVHYFDPHYSYRHHDGPDFAAERVGRLDGSQSIKTLRQMAEGLGADEQSFLIDLYDEEIAFTDAGIGLLLADLETLGLDDETVVAVTADHGEEFLERGWIGHVRTLYDELVHVPLIVRVAGGSAGRTVSEPVSLVSLAPTLLELAGLDAAPEQFQAPSLAPTVRAGIDPAPQALLLAVDFDPIQASSEVKRTSKQGLVADGWKIVKDSLAGTLELFDLSRDPRESHDRSAEEPERLRSMRNQLERMLADLGRDSLPQDGAGLTLDAEGLEQLRALGYVGDEDTTTDVSRDNDG